MSDQDSTNLGQNTVSLNHDSLGQHLSRHGGYNLAEVGSYIVQILRIR
jgi:hypothetical protein